MELERRNPKIQRVTPPPIWRGWAAKLRINPFELEARFDTIGRTVIHGLHTRLTVMSETFVDSELTVQSASRDWATVPVWALLQGYYPLPQDVIVTDTPVYFRLNNAVPAGRYLDVLVSCSVER